MSENLVETFHAFILNECEAIGILITYFCQAENSNLLAVNNYNMLKQAKSRSLEP